ncbi:MAG TPA: tetratricopeptide repeat protein [Rhodocyclaceae bacterium]|nr:tetratricopeptide repeat protein [Rhodocyclaceae bacterium]
MNSGIRCIFFAIAFVSMCIAAPVAFGMGGSETPKASINDPDYASGKAAIDRKDWNAAIASFEKVVAHDNKNADAYNWLGYASRKSGKLDVAFTYYDKALAIDPKHKGAHEYVGEAYLMANNLPKAEEQLAMLARLCNAKCDEYQDLKEDIDDYKAGKKS